MKHIRVSILAAILTAVMLLADARVCSACSGVYIGLEASADGTVILARCNDSRGLLTHYVNVVPRVENKAGRTMPLDSKRTIQIELPETTFQYTETPFADSYRKAEDANRDAAACTNEYGVAMTMSVTAFSCSAAMEADPWEEKAFADAKQILNDLQWKLSEESNSMQMGMNPETHEILKEKRKIEPLQIELDPAAYAQVPDGASAKETGGSSGSRHSEYLIMGVIALLIMIAAAIVLTRRKKEI